jgi:hypothetical protein
MPFHPFDEHINELPLPGEVTENRKADPSFRPVRLAITLWILLLLSLATICGIVQLML